MEINDTKVLRMKVNLFFVLLNDAHWQMLKLGFCNEMHLFNTSQLNTCTIL